MVQRRSAPFDPLCGSLACQTNWFSASLGCDVQLSAAVASNSTGSGTWVCRPEPGKLLLIFRLLSTPLFPFLLPHTAMLIFAKYSSAFFMLFRRGHMPALRFLSAFFSRGCQCFSKLSVFPALQTTLFGHLAVWSTACFWRSVFKPTQRKHFRGHMPKREHWNSPSLECLILQSCGGWDVICQV